MVSRDDTVRFIRSSFRSVWSIELLLLLKREPRPWTREEIVSALRASDLVVSQGLDALVAAGLVAVEEGGRASYRPASPDTAALVDAAETHYARSPDAVRRMIVDASTGSLGAFADAFRLWKD
jgi:DNA-binding transcriptional regulator GbsR (MarR family)